MGTTSQLAYETATDALNARDLGRFADGLADDVAFQGPGGIGGEGKTACVAFYRSLFDAFPDARLEIHDVHVADDVTVEEGTFTGTHTGIARTGRAVALDYVQVAAIQGRQAGVDEPDARPAADARAARANRRCRGTAMTRLRPSLTDPVPRLGPQRPQPARVGRADRTGARGDRRGGRLGCGDGSGGRRASPAI